MELFVDSANLNEIEFALERGFIRGITTNPSLLSKEPKFGFEKHIQSIIALIKSYSYSCGHNVDEVSDVSIKTCYPHLSVEVFSRDPNDIVVQALDFKNKFNYPKMSVKVQIGWDELKAIRALSREGISINCTACMSISQAIMAAAAGAKYVSLFWGRIRDGGHTTDARLNEQRVKALESGSLDEFDFDPAKIVGSVRNFLDKSYPEVQIIVGSIRKVTDIRDACLAGAHIVTVPPKFFKPMSSHFKTDEVVDQFFTDFSSWV